MKMEAYCLWVFDCDGVILESNRIKTDAFREIALPFGEGVAEEFVSYHQRHGGVSRFEKIKFLFNNLIGDTYDQESIDEAVARFGAIVRRRLLEAPLTRGIVELLEYIPRDVRRIVVSGGMQEELREVFRARALDGYFDAIYGSPATKREILERERAADLLDFPGIMVGDSRLDYEVALEFGLDFIFLYECSEFRDYKIFFAHKGGVAVFPSAEEFLSVDLGLARRS